MLINVGYLSPERFLQKGGKNKPEEIDLLYGLNVVLPAIEQSRRTLYALYYKDSMLSRERDDPGEILIPNCEPQKHYSQFSSNII